MLRKIIRIDEAKCNGCGACVPACAEGAIRIIDGKARLVSEIYCDGLGACLGDCPQGAISMEEREAAPFDEAAALAHAAANQADARPAGRAHATIAACPGSAARMLEPARFVPVESQGDGPQPYSALTNWPVQLALTPIKAPFFEDADLLIAGDCVPFAYTDFHRRFVAGRTLLVGCPKLDDATLYRKKLARIFAENSVQSLRVLYMEVPCCYGLVHLVRQALQESGKDLPLTVTKISIKGELLETHELQGL